MKSMLQHSFVLDALDTTGADTFSHFEVLIEEHRAMNEEENPSRLQKIVPTVGVFHTPLPLRQAFEVYNEKHRLTKRKHIQISFNEIRHILNLAQIMAMRHEVEGESQAPSALSTSNIPFEPSATLSPSLGCEQLNGPRLISFDGDQVREKTRNYSFSLETHCHFVYMQTLYSDGANFDSNPRLANYLFLLLRHGVTVAVVTAAGYEYKVEKYEYRLSGLLHFFQKKGLSPDECSRFYLFGGECNYLLQLGEDYCLHPVRENGPGGWKTATSFLKEGPGNWEEGSVNNMLSMVEDVFSSAIEELNLRGRVIRKLRSVGMCPKPGQEITRESLDEVVLRSHEVLAAMNGGNGPGLPYCAFNGGSDAWVDAGNKRVGVKVLQSYLGIAATETLHIGDQFLNTGNDYAARAVSPCIWIIHPNETTYILKSILRLSNVNVEIPEDDEGSSDTTDHLGPFHKSESGIDFKEMERRSKAVKMMDVYTGELVNK